MLRPLGIISITLLIVGGLAWQIARIQAGVKPTKPLATTTFSWKAEFEDFLKPLESAYLGNPRDPSAIKNYAAGLEKILSIKFIPEIATELIKVNQSLLDLGPEYTNTELLNKQADLLFGIKQFDLAELLYRKLLEQDSGNHDLRGRLASALSFQGKYTEALKELQTILDRQPDAFQALAYMGITYAQMGNMPEALKYTRLALKHAPTAEARQRLQVFLNRLEPEITPGEKTDPADQGLVAFEAYLKQHPIAGTKYQSIEVNEQTLKIYFKDFPLDKMPEFAREKFITNLKSALPADSGIKQIELIDQTSSSSLTVDN